MALSSRRTFLSALLGTGVGLLVSGFAYSIFRYLAPLKSQSSSQKVTFKESEIAAGGAKFIEYDGKSAVVVRLKNGSIAAFSAVCTHLGCVVQWQKDKDQFLCPCHAGLYNSDGAVISGPPPKPLPKLKIEINNGVIIVG